MAFEIVTTQTPPNHRTLECKVRINGSYLFISKGLTLKLAFDKHPFVLIIKDSDTCNYYISIAPVGSPNAYKMVHSSTKELNTLKLKNKALCQEILVAYGIAGHKATFKVADTPIKAMGLDAYLLIKTP